MSKGKLQGGRGLCKTEVQYHWEGRRGRGISTIMYVIGREYDEMQLGPWPVYSAAAGPSNVVTLVQRARNCGRMGLHSCFRLT